MDGIFERMKRRAASWILVVCLLESVAMGSNGSIRAGHIEGARLCTCSGSKSLDGSPLLRRPDVTGMNGLGSPMQEETTRTDELDSQMWKVVEYVQLILDVRMNNEGCLDLMSALKTVMESLCEDSNTVESRVEVVETWVGILAFGSIHHARLIEEIYFSESKRSLEAAAAKNRRRRQRWIEFFSSEENFGLSLPRYSSAERRLVFDFQKYFRRLLVSGSLSYLETVELFRDAAIRREQPVQSTEEGLAVDDQNSVHAGYSFGHDSERLLCMENLIADFHHLEILSLEQRSTTIEAAGRLVAALEGIRGRRRAVDAEFRGAGCRLEVLSVRLVV